MYRDIDYCRLFCMYTYMIPAYVLLFTVALIYMGDKKVNALSPYVPLIGIWPIIMARKHKTQHLLRCY